MRERKNSQIVVRLTQRDRERFDREAESKGLDTSSFIRMTLKQALPLGSALVEVPADEPPQAA